MWHGLLLYNKPPLTLWLKTIINLLAYFSVVQHYGPASNVRPSNGFSWTH